MSLILCAIFFISGTAALLFETLWFRQAGLSFGNSVWASSVVLASFMGGLALGNALAAGFGARLRRPVRFYAWVELTIAISGVTLVWILPEMVVLLRPALRALAGQPLLLNGLRLTCGFALLLIPATAMGVTLPVLVKTLLARDPNFGSVLGRLYGWNTLGAVLGAVAGEAFLLERFGVHGTAAVAGALNVLAAAVALTLAHRLEVRPPRDAAPAAAPSAWTGLAWRCCAAAFTGGGILLALEVVWFRFLHLFVHSGPLSFSLMLAVVLTGIGLGGFAAGRLLRWRPTAYRHASVLALLTGAVSVGLYRGFSLALAPFGTSYVRAPEDILWLCTVLILPVSMLSGILFTMMGAALDRDVKPETRAAGLLTFSNTVGAGLGSVVAGFVLLPMLGMERSFQLLAWMYGVVALLMLGARAREIAKPNTAPAAIAAAIFLAVMALFPTGMMRNEYMQLPIQRADRSGNAELVTMREGRTETIFYLRRNFLGSPVSYSLLTDGYSMSGSSVKSRRYMKLYTYWPVALAAPPRTALIICFGVGSTTKSLTDTSSLELIDVVDISKDILELGAIVYGEPNHNPLSDPRVRVHVDDGRYFLQTTEQRYDLITGEPPPPKFAGVVNLYTREYFQLVYDRLAEGGIHTYWLPTSLLLVSDSKAIIAAFCEVFSDCSLWGGTNKNWMLVGSRNGRWHRSDEAVLRQWQDPVVAPELEVLGFEVPEQIGSLFMGDADTLRELTKYTPPLTDNYPKRLKTTHLVDIEQQALLRRWMDTDIARERFAASDYIDEVWPPDLRERTLAYFDVQRILNRVVERPRAPVGLREWYEDLHMILTETPLETLSLWHLGSNVDQQQILARQSADLLAQPEHMKSIAMGAVAARDFERAEDLFRQLQELRPRDAPLLYLRLYMLGLQGRSEEAAALVRDAGRWLPLDGRDRSYWIWYQETFPGAPNPYRDNRRGRS